MTSLPPLVDLDFVDYSHHALELEGQDSSVPASPKTMTREVSWLCLLLLAEMAQTRPKS